METQDTTQVWNDLHHSLERFVRWHIDDASDVQDVLQTVFLRVHRSHATAMKESTIGKDISRARVSDAASRSPCFAAATKKRAAISRPPPLKQVPPG